MSFYGDLYRFLLHSHVFLLDISKTTGFLILLAAIFLMKFWTCFKSMDLDNHFYPPVELILDQHPYFSDNMNKKHDKKSLSLTID